LKTSAKPLGWFYELADRVWQFIARTVFVRFVFELPVELIREQASHKRVTFVLHRGGLLEWLILSSWCRSQGMGGIVFANRLRILMLSRPKALLDVVLRRKSYDDIFLSDLPGLRLVFMTGRERSKLYVPTPSEKLLCEVHSRLSAQKSETVLFIPVFILWRKHLRGASRHLSEYLFGLSSNPNWIGKFWFLLRKRDDSVVRGLAPIPLEMTDRAEAIEETESMRVAKQTRRRILVALNQETRVVLGPRYRSPSLVKETILRDPEVQSLIDQVSKAEGVDRKRIMSRSYQLLTEIVATYSYRVIEVLYVLLTWLFSKVFDGLDYKEKEWQQVREVMKHKPVVFVPCHRSHLDYLVIPYLMFQHDMVTPYVAAGVNLSFWPVGPLLRSAGAFFIRRSFRGDLLYSLLLRKYIHYLLQNRYNVKFFIEGTRSRSGKMLAPAYGILKMVLETCSRKVVEDIALVPVSICYDEVPEQGSYSRELSGGQKVQESAAQLLKSRKIIRRRFGKVYVRMGQPISAREVLEASAQTGQDQTLTLQKTAFQISKTICDVTPITAKSIVATVALTHRAGALTYEDLVSLCHWLSSYVHVANMPLSTPDSDSFSRSLEQTIRRLIRSGMLNVNEAVPRRYQVDARRRMVLNFYKNNSIHCFIVPTITALAVMDWIRCGSNGEGSDEGRAEIVRRALDIRDVLKFDFFFSPRRDFEQDVVRAGRFLFGDAEWQECRAHRMGAGFLEKNKDLENLSVFLRILGELLESYYLMGQYFSQMGESTWEKKALVNKVIKFAESRQAMNAIRYPESISAYNFGNALLWYEHSGWVQTRKSDDGTAVTRVVAGETVQEGIKRLGDWLDLLDEKPASFFT
jgi:glycerol-3-phosphate O-acyltransferase